MDSSPPPSLQEQWWLGRWQCNQLGSSDQQGGLLAISTSSNIDQGARVRLCASAAGLPSHSPPPTTPTRTRLAQQHQTAHQLRSHVCGGYVEQLDTRVHVNLSGCCQAPKGHTIRAQCARHFYIFIHHGTVCVNVYVCVCAYLCVCVHFCVHVCACACMCIKNLAHPTNHACSWVVHCKLPASFQAGHLCCRSSCEALITDLATSLSKGQVPHCQCTYCTHPIMFDTDSLTALSRCTRNRRPAVV